MCTVKGSKSVIVNTQIDSHYRMTEEGIVESDARTLSSTVAVHGSYVCSMFVEWYTFSCYVYRHVCHYLFFFLKSISTINCLTL